MVVHTTTDQRVVHAEITKRQVAALEAVRDYIRVPSFSDTGEGMAECAAYTRDLLGVIAPDAAVVETEGYPVVFGTVRSRRPNAPTLTVYGLYDVTPTMAHEWTVEPLAAEIVDAKTLGVLPDLGPLLVGRGVNNHKGPVLASILVVRTLLDIAGDVPVNLIYVIEGEEEIGSPNLSGFVARHRDVLAASQGVWLPCMQQNSAGAMTLRRAYKGMLCTEIECRGGEWGGTRDGRHVWAGHSAWIDAPLMRLIRALATLYDDNQHVTLDGLADRITPLLQPDDPEIQQLQAASNDNPQWERNMLINLNVARMQGGKRMAEHLPHYMLATTINVQSITGGYQGPTFYTNMPGAAKAKLDLRFPPGIEPMELVALMQAHLQRRGFAELQINNARGYAGAYPVAEDADTLLHAARVTAERYDVPVAVWPIANNCSPASLLTTLDQPIPYSIAGMGHGDRAHAPDEYITIDSVEKLMHWTVDYLHDWAALLALS